MNLSRRVCLAHLRREFSSQTPPKTAVVMLNMGGPAQPSETKPFLENLFSDPEIIPLGPLQPWLSKLIAYRRTPKVQKQYEEIGGSPILKWTQQQGDEMCQRLDKQRPESAPHKAYPCFRYVAPFTEDVLEEMKRDGAQRAVAFLQYPQWSCTTSGSSINQLWRQARKMGLEDEFQWTVIDRWFRHPGFIGSVADRIRSGLEKFAESDRDQVRVVFSAHSLPNKTVNKGDPYVPEVASSCKLVMQKLLNDGIKNKHICAWQSQVGYLPWQGPQTGDVLKGLGKQGIKHVLIVPIAFTSDHIETLFEIDIEYAEDAEKAGITHFHRAEALNDSPVFFDALADIVSEHLDSGEHHTVDFRQRCFGCITPERCRKVLNPPTAAQPSA